MRGAEPDAPFSTGRHVMKRIAFLSIATLVATVASGGAHALSNRTFVSGNGSDNSPCSLTAPCRSVAGAIAQTSPGGEIAVLDTAGYGAVTITQAVSIINEEGVEACNACVAALDMCSLSFDFFCHRPESHGACDLGVQCLYFTSP
jgi:hypothetical protein